MPFEANASCSRFTRMKVWDKLKPMKRYGEEAMFSTDLMYTQLGKRIKQQRILARMTQEKLAEKAGISLSFLGHIERGTRKASLDTVVKICNALKVSPNMLLQDSLDGNLLGESTGLSVTHRRLLREIADNIAQYTVELPEEK